MLALRALDKVAPFGKTQLSVVLLMNCNGELLKNSEAQADPTK